MMKFTTLLAMVALLVLSGIGREQAAARRGTVLNGASNKRTAPASNLQTPCVPAPTGMVSWWPFDDGTATDVSDSNNGVVLSGTLTSGKVNGALTNPRIDVPDNINLRMNNPFTIEGWVQQNTPGTGSGQMIIIKGGQQFSVSDACPCNYHVQIIPTGELAFTVRSGDLQNASALSTMQLTDGIFHHFAGVFDGAAVMLYVDGAFQGQDNSKAASFQTFGVVTSPDPVNIGYYNHILYGPIAFFSGKIDEITIYNRALSAAEVTTLFNAGSAGKCKPGANNAPVAICQNVTISAGADCTAEASINNGSFDPDGDALTITQSPAGPYPLGTTDVMLTVTDSNGASSQCAATVTVNNPSPAVTITVPPSGAIYPVGALVNFTGAFTDNSGTHTAIWMFDSLTAAGTVNEASGQVSAAYTFATPGVYKVKLTVDDGCGGAGLATTIGGLDALVVIYDPSGGFVTGGGWINSPAGAYTPNPSLTGKANFGFVSKYQNGASVPTGNTEFQFKAGNLNFSSTGYEWLVVAGKKAQYKGFGTINGNGGYRFMLTAIDGQQPGGSGQDKFRIRIWSDSGGVVYDNQMNDPDSNDPTTVLGGGSIVIHKP